MSHGFSYLASWISILFPFYSMIVTMAKNSTNQISRIIFATLFYICLCISVRSKHK